MCRSESSVNSILPRRRKCWNTTRLCFLTEAKRFLYRLRCEGRIPHLEKMNLFVRLLLEIKTDFLPLPFVLIASLRAFLRHSGIEANIDGVASGSRTNLLVRTLLLVKTAHSSIFPTPTLRGPTKTCDVTGSSCNTTYDFVTSLN